MAEKLAPPGELFVRKGRESVSSLDLDRLTPGEAAGEESSDSEGEQDGSSHKLIRKVSTSGQMRTKVKETLLAPRSYWGGGVGELSCFGACLGVLGACLWVRLFCIGKSTTV